MHPPTSRSRRRPRRGTRPRPGGRHGHGVLTERATDEGRLGVWIRCIAVLPAAAVDTVEDLGPAGDHADGHAAADDLAVRREISLHAVPRLRAARMEAEAG